MSIKQVTYYNMNCLNCGESTRADLVFFDLSEVISEVIEEDSPYAMLKVIDLRFYYTIRDLTQVFSFRCDYKNYYDLNIRVGHIKSQLEFITHMPFNNLGMIDRESASFDRIMRLLHIDNDHVLNYLELLLNLTKASRQDLVVRIPLTFTLGYDDMNRAIPYSLKYKYKGEEHVSYKHLCPNCGSFYNNEAGKHSEYTIGVVGLRGSGKSELIKRMLLALEESSLFSLSYNEDEGFLYLTITLYEKTHNFIIIDVPGDLFEENRNELINKYKNLRNIDLLWCCIKLSSLKEDDDLSLLSESIEYCINKRVKTCIVMTHSDVLNILNGINEEYFLEDQSVDFDKIITNRNEIRAYTKGYYNFEYSMDDLFHQFNICHVSSLEDSNVLLPFIWSLCALDIVKGRKTVVNKNILGEKSKRVDIEERDLFKSEEDA